MQDKSDTKKEQFSISEDEIFKSLGHDIRRNIIRLIGNQKGLTFTEILNELETIDSPSLSYHLKSLQLLLKYEKNKYQLSEIGDSAYNLLLKIDQSHKITRFKKRFTYAYIMTVACWTLVMTLVPTFLHIHFIQAHIINDEQISFIFITIQVTLTIVAAVNYIVILILRKV